MSRLDPWRNGLDAPKGEDADKILQANFDEQAKFNDKIGLYLLGEQKTSTEVSLTSTSFVPWTGLKLSVATSGGVVIVFVQPQARVVANSLTGRLMVNGEEKRRWLFSVSGGDATHCPAWVWVGALPAQQNVFSMEYMTNTGTVEVQDNLYGTTTSTIQVLEFAKG